MSTRKSWKLSGKKYISFCLEIYQYWPFICFYIWKDTSSDKYKIIVQRNVLSKPSFEYYVNKYWKRDDCSVFHELNLVWTLHIQFSFYLKINVYLWEKEEIFSDCHCICKKKLLSYVEIISLVSGVFREYKVGTLARIGLARDIYAEKSIYKDSIAPERPDSSAYKKIDVLISQKK